MQMVDISGKQLGAYKVIKLIGRGGMAAVYQAYHEATDRHVAIKVMLPDIAVDETFRIRFEREAKTLAGLQHVHILPVFDYGQQDDISYLVMPFLPGRTLADRIRDKELSLTEIAIIFRQLASALDFAHSKGILHRDLKPENIMMDEGGNVLLADFGLTRLLGDSSASAKLTSDSSVIGTPAYMSPEQGQGRDLDHRSDLYSLTVVLYEMLTGTVPYKADTPVAVIFKHISDPPPSATGIRKKLPHEIDDVIAKGMAKQPQDRFDTATEIADTLDAAISGETLSLGRGNTTTEVSDRNQQTTRAAVVGTTREAGGNIPGDTIIFESSNDEKPKGLPTRKRNMLVGIAAVVIAALGAGGFFAFNIDNFTDTGLYRSADSSMWAHDGEVVTMDVSNDGNILLTGGADNVTRAWTVEDAELLTEVEGVSADVLSLDLHPEGTELVLSGRDGNGLTWSVEDDEQVLTFLDGGSPIHRYSPDGRLLATINGRTLLVGLHQAPEDVAARYEMFEDSNIIESLATLPVQETSPSDERFSNFAFDPVLKDLGQTEDERSIIGYHIITGDEIGNIYRWQVALEELYASPDDISEEMQAVLADFSNPNPYTYLSIELIDKARQTTDSEDEVTAIAFNPDGSRFATADEQGTVVVWSTKAFDQTRIFPGSDYEAVYDIAFSGSGDILAIATEAVDTLLYDVERSEVIGELYTDAGDATSVVFTPDDTLIVGANDGNLYIWYLAGELDTES